jgi:hypothetical protein
MDSILGRSLERDTTTSANHGRRRQGVAAYGRPASGQQTKILPLELHWYRIPRTESRQRPTAIKDAPVRKESRGARWPMHVGDHEDESDQVHDNRWVRGAQHARPLSRQSPSAALAQRPAPQCPAPNAQRISPSKRRTDRNDHCERVDPPARPPSERPLPTTTVRALIATACHGHSPYRQRARTDCVPATPERLPRSGPPADHSSTERDNGAGATKHPRPA